MNHKHTTTTHRSHKHDHNHTTTTYNHSAQPQHTKPQHTTTTLKHNHRNTTTKQLPLCVCVCVTPVSKEDASNNSPLVVKQVRCRGAMNTLEGIAERRPFHCVVIFPRERTCSNCLIVNHADVETLQFSLTSSPYRLQVKVYCTCNVIATVEWATFTDLALASINLSVLHFAWQVVMSLVFFTWFQ